MARRSSQRQPTYVGRRRISGVFHVERRDGTVAYHLRLRVDGKPQWLTLDGVRTPSEAEEQALLLRGRRAEGDLASVDRSITISKLVAAYLDHAQSRLAPATHALYSQRLRDYVEPTLGRRKVCDVTANDLRSLLDRMRDGRIRGNRGILSGATQHGVVVALGALLRFARKSGVVSRSPLTDLDRDDKPSQARKRQPRYLTPEQIERLLGHTGEQFRPLLTTIAFSGLRLREATGLRWKDVAFDAGVITVAGQLAKDGTWTATTKTKASQGTVPLLPRVARDLKAWRTKQSKRGLHLVRPDALVFTTSTGQPQNGRNVLRSIYAAGDAAKLNGEGQAKVNVHDLRHSVVSNALDSGFTLPEAARLARHASPRVTAAVYSGLLEGREAEMADKLVAAGYGS